MTETIYDQWGRSFVLPGLYEDFPHFFRLIHYPVDSSDAIALDISEPIGWSKIQLQLVRDDQEHALNYEYTTKSSACEFNAASGRDFVEGIFRANGEDATVLLQYGLRIPTLTSPGFDVIEYEGRLMFDTYKRVRRNPSCGLERSSLMSKVLAKWDTSVELNAVQSLDGKIIQPPTFTGIPLTSQSIAERFTCNVDGGKRVEQNFVGDTNGHIWVQFDTSQPQIAEIDDFATGKPMGVSESEGPITNDEWLFKFRSAGSRQVKIEVSYGIWLIPKKKTISLGSVKVTGWRLTTTLTLLKKSGERIDFAVTKPMSEGSLKKPPTGFGISEIYLVAEPIQFDQQIDTAAGDKLFLYGLVEFTHNKNELAQTQFATQLITQKIDISGRSMNQASSASGLAIGEAINSALTITTGLPDRFRSSFYGLASARYPIDGCGARRVIMNGFSIRNFKASERPLSLSMQDLVGSMKVIDCTGIAFTAELDENNQPRDVMVMESINHFYKPVELLRLDEVSDYREEVITSELYSTVECGYQEWVSEGASALEELFVTQQTATPLKHEQGKKTLTSKLLASALAIERTRREQFADSPKDGTSYDEKGFIIQCKPIKSYTNVLFFIEALILHFIQVPSAITWLTPGMKINIGNAGSNSGTYTVASVSDAAKKPWTFTVKEKFTFGAANATIAPAGNFALQPETGADLAYVSGLIAPKDTYNLRLTPGRILWANAPLWAGCLVDKQNDAVSRKTRLPGNRSVTTMLPETDTCGRPGLVNENEPIAVDELRPQLIFRPRRITFKARLSHAQLQRLRIGHMGLLAPELNDSGVLIDPNYGYVSCLDESGIRVAGYLMNLTWSPGDEQAVFELKQLALDLNDTTSGLDCAQFAGWSLVQAEQADDQTRRRIELCRWLDVDPL